jgi:hypothetical protein
MSPRHADIEAAQAHSRYPGREDNYVGCPSGRLPDRLTALTFDPATPTLKPIAVFSSARSGLLSSPDDQAAASRVPRGEQSLPDALRALWSNLKILSEIRSNRAFRY